MEVILFTHLLIYFFFYYKTSVKFLYTLELKIPKIIGWQPNERGKAGPNVLNANAVMNTQSIMEQAVDLNIRLMKWRLWPNVNVEKLSNTKCLLLGAGTLGCAVARTLMGWGVRDITFVDNGKVSFSNPARQVNNIIILYYTKLI